MRNKHYIILGLLVSILIIVTTRQIKSPTSKPVINVQPKSEIVRTTILKAIEIPFLKEKKITLQLLSNYTINVAAEGLQHPRFMAWSPDHRLFVGDMTNASDTKTGRVLVLDNFDKTSGKFLQTHIFINNLRNPNSVAFYTDKKGIEWLYVALTEKLVRYKYVRGSTETTDEPEILAEFPTSGQTPAEGGWHLTRTVTFNREDMYVSVGSSCNSCEEKEEARATILKMSPDGTNSHIIAKGLRNAVGITFANGGLFVTTNEIDHIGEEKPNDLIRKIVEGTNYNWPYCYQHNNQVFEETSITWTRTHSCKDVPLAWAELEPHSAPLGIRYFDTTFNDPLLQDSFLVATHGSGKPKIGTGYKIQILKEGKSSVTLLSGFLQDSKRVGRPVDILQNDTNSFFISDDFNGAIYFVKYSR